MFEDVADNEWSTEHIARHNLTLDDVREVLANPHHTTTGHDDTTLAFGRNNAGAYIAVVLAPSKANPTLGFVVTARTMTKPEKAAYQKRVKE